MSDQQLLNILRTLNYDAETIRTVMAATEGVEANRIAKIRAERDARAQQLLTPLQASAQSPRHAAQLRELDGRIYNLSACTWRLPKDGSHVDPLELQKAIAKADIVTRCEIKLAAAALGLIPA